MTELATTAVGRARLVLKEDNADLKKVATALVADAPEPEAPQPTAPKVVTLNQEVQEAMDRLPGVFGVVQPDTVRSLTDGEIVALYIEREAVKKVEDTLKGREEAIKEAIRNHIDCIAVEEDLVSDETPVDSKGHFVLSSKGNPFRVSITGTNKAWSSEYREGSVAINGGALLDMYEAGEIDRETYLAFTREVRVFDEAKAFAAIVKDPARLEVLARITQKGQPGTALFVRNEK